MDASRFTRAYPGFAYEGSLEGVVARLERNIPDSVTAKGAHASRPRVIGDDGATSTTAVATSTSSGSGSGGSSNSSTAGGAASIPCPVCGSHHLQEVLDLRSQPLANDFKASAREAMECERFPLRLMRCRSCQHMHLSQVCHITQSHAHTHTHTRTRPSRTRLPHALTSPFRLSTAPPFPTLALNTSCVTHTLLPQLVSRARLFSDYLYVSGTSSTLLQYFEWLADKIVGEAAPCDDGSSGSGGGSASGSGGGGGGGSAGGDGGGGGPGGTADALARSLGISRGSAATGGGGGAAAAATGKTGASAPPGASSCGGRARTVLEIACNDGSQLDKFKARGWRTYGVDPAANIVPQARAKGHIVRVGFWGAPPPSPSAEPAAPGAAPSDDEAAAAAMPLTFDAIVAQNVLAHVPSPVSFLRACAAAMGDRTKLYVQTSQCQMHQQGQFDTAYHEHLSFFTSHSLVRAARCASASASGAHPRRPVRALHK